MGQNASKQLIVCSFCESEIITCDDKENGNNNNEQKCNNNNNNNSDSNVSQSMIIELPPNTILCQRCHGFYKKKVENNNNNNRRRISLFASNDNNNNTESLISNNNNNNNKIRRYIQHLHIAPFQDTLQEIEEKEICEEYIINTYLKPYFKQYKDIEIHARNRIIIKNVEFKVFGCYPPKGYVNESTQFHINDNDGRLITLRWRAIRQIHLLPTNASYKTYNKQHHNKEEEDDEEQEDEEKQLLISHIKPYLKEYDKSLYINHCNSIKGSHRHLMEQETFISQGIEWRVMKCLPPDGYIDNRSTIYCHGEPIMDCNKISIRPIYESLPNSHKNYTPRQIKKYYLDPFFRGRCRYIDHSREIKIFGVDFSIRESLPSAGIITLSTNIDYRAAPVKSAELQEMQQMEDMELARQLQEEENNRNRRIISPSNNGNYHQVTLADITEIFERLQAAQGHGVEQEEQVNNSNNDPFLQFIRQLQMASQNHQRNRSRNNGVAPQLIDRLPTHKYIADTTTTQEIEEQFDINTSCRICLEYYEHGEELRTLPCFHKYHKECVDKWFQMSSKCPICKTSITQQLRQ